MTEPTPEKDTQGAVSLSLFPSSFVVFDMKLLHHYTISTCYTLSRIPVIQAVWRDHVPRVGFAFPFVLQSLLAVSALHLAYSDPSRRTSCISRAQEHQSAAVRSVVPIIPILATENSAALFLFSSLTCVFSCVNLQDQSNFLLLFEKGRLSEWVQLFRGIKAVIENSKEDFSKGRLGPIFMNGVYLSATRQDPRSLEQGRMYVWELKQMIRQENSHDRRLLQVYEEALGGLSRIMSISLKPGEGRKLETADVFAWVLEVPSEYLDLLRQAAPIALIIFAYFCVCLRQIEWMWWTEGLSGRLMTQLYNVMDEKYRGWLQWPQEQIGWVPPERS